MRQTDRLESIITMALTADKLTAKGRRSLATCAHAAASDIQAMHRMERQLRDAMPLLAEMVHSGPTASHRESAADVLARATLTFTEQD